MADIDEGTELEPDLASRQRSSGSGRVRMSLTLDDLQLLRKLRLLVESGEVPATMREVATQLGIQRTLLYRLRDRVNEQLQGDFEWIRDGRLVLPAEVFRVTRLMLSDDGEVAGTSFPVMSAGSAARMLLTEYLLRRDLTAPRIAYRRSADVAAALASRDIDLALLNRIDGHPDVRDCHEAPSGRGGSDTAMITLRRWEAVAVGPFEASRAVRRVKWEVASFAWRLEQLACPDRIQNVGGRNASGREESATELGSLAASGNAIRLTGYDVAFEMLRRQLPIATTVPSIYLTEHDRQRFRIDPTPVRVTGRLVAVFRRDDEQRFESWFDQGTWNQCGLESTVVLDES
jgi:transposase-like protein